MQTTEPKNIKKLVQKFFSGDLTPTESEILEQWYQENPSQKPEWFLVEEHKDALKHKLFANIQAQMERPKKTVPLWSKISIAAAVLIIASVGVILVNRQTDLPQNLSVANVDGQIRKVVLPDHSLVWLKGNSQIDFPSEFSDTTRNVTLHGEALFEVAKDKLHPFVINSGSYVTRVLGTSFNLKEDRKSGAFNVTVLTGKVQVASNPTAKVAAVKPILITPGNKLELNSFNPIAHFQITTDSKQDAVVIGTEYPMSFDKNSFVDIKTRIEQKFNVLIDANMEMYTSCSISANLTDQSLENTMKVIAAIIGADFKINKNKVTITGGGCN